MGVSERKERERQEMRRRVLETAMKLFLEDGYENVSIRKIADRIEYSPATIYFYFQDKDEIFYALYMMAFEQFYEYLKPIESVADPLERLRKGGKAYLKFALDNPECYDLMFILQAPVRKIMEHQGSEFSMRGYELLKRNIEECVEAGAFPEETDVEAATVATWAFIHGVASLVIRQRLRMIPEKKLKTTINGALAFMMKNLEK